jgi:DNA polymerase-3 subunit gamma/tau
LENGTNDNFVEVDAATNSGKADVKRITEEIEYATFSGRRRVYLLDESHRLSQDALDALLKPMEETVGDTEDKRLICIFCTTEPERMRATILSRCAPAFYIETIKPEGVADRLAYVCEQENIPYDREALVLIAERTECHIRDGLKAVEGVSMLGGATMDTVKTYLHLDLNQSYLDLLLALGGESFAPVSTVLRHLQGKTSPLTCYERLAELCLMAYKFVTGLDTNPPSYWDKEALQRVGEHHGARLVELAAFFASKPSRASYSALECDLLMSHNGQALTAPAVSTPVAARAVAAMQAPVAPAAPASQPATKPSAPANAATPQSGTVIAGGVKIDPRAQRRAEANQQPQGLELSTTEFGALLAKVVAELAWTNGTTRHG